MLPTIDIINKTQEFINDKILRFEVDYKGGNPFHLILTLDEFEKIMSHF